MFHALVVGLMVLLVPASASADEWVEGGTAVVASVVDGDTVELGDGRQVRLPGLQAPKLPLGRKGFDKWPLADESKAALEKMVLGRTVTLRFGGAQKDRHGRTLAHLFYDDGKGGESWVQGDMLLLGMARLYTFPDNRAAAADMRMRELLARKAGVGMWALAFYQVRTPDSVVDDIGSFQIVDGTVREAALVKGTLYLNFGDDWRTDFTVRITKDDLRSFKKAGIDPMGYQGKRIEVRGWVSSRNGAMIDASHPEQISLSGR